MELPSDFIEKNQHFLKSCILYEVLRKKPIFESYRNFCYTVGQDAMEYRDFEFWYYRFYQGELDFDYDRSADPEPKALVDMPVVLMNKIAQHLDSIERARLLTMNHAIKNVADSFPPVFDKLDITLSEDDLLWTLNNKRFSCRKDYTNSEPNISKKEECEEGNIEKCIENLDSVLRIPNIQFNHLSLDLLEEAPNLMYFLPITFNAKSVFIYGYSTNQVVQFLSTIVPGHLESIRLDGLYSIEREHFNRILETDQFKQANSVEISMIMKFNVEDLVKFSHLKKFKFWLISRNTFQNVPRIRDILSTFETLESCEMDYFGVMDGSSITEFASALGAEIPIGPLVEDEHMIITHRYQIPESNECLEFEISEGEYTCRVKIVKIR